MKYLISPIQLGQLLEAKDYNRRAEIISNIMELQYILGTSDDWQLDDHIKINNHRRQRR